jgi:hypothetical protein
MVGWRKIKQNKQNEEIRNHCKMVKKQTVRKVAKRRPNRSTFGAVSAINTAPVSVGNSVRGSKPRVTQSIDGARVVGRDFAFSLSATAAAVTGWEVIGGMPLTPCAFPSTILRNYCQMFAKFKVNKCVLHYITSSPTSQAGDVLFYYERDRLAPFPDYSNSSFLPYVLSDDHTIIGPQWTNHSASLKPVAEWKSTLYGNQTDINEDAAGTFFLFSKTNAANSPGYLLLDYDISFREMAVNPRAGSLPIARAQSTFVSMDPGSALTDGTAITWSVSSSFKTIANVNSAVPTGWTVGDIYKVVLQVTSSTQTNATWAGVGTTPTAANLLQYADDTAITVDDGFTCYLLATTSTAGQLYATLEQAVTSTRPLEANVTATSVVVGLNAEIQFVRSVDALTQSSY